MMRAHLLSLTLALSGLLPVRLAAQSPPMPLTPAADEWAAAALRDARDSLVTEAMHKWHTRPPRPLTRWRSALSEAERIVGKRWRGPQAVVLLVPDDGHGFPCDAARCLGRFLGARIALAEGDSTTVTQLSIILVAESMISRRDVWMHELTHALLEQHGLFDESARHDRRFFRSDHALDMGGN